MKHFYLLCLVFLLGCQADAPDTQEDNYQVLEGETMGTYYRVTYSDTIQRNLKPIIDSMLNLVNLEVSTYVPNSTISEFNKTDETLDVTGKQHFLNNFITAQAVYKNTGGYFDPTVMPLVNYYGFGNLEKDKSKQVDQSAIDSLLQFVGFDKVEFINGEQMLLKKQIQGIQLDFSAIAKGYGVDLVGQILNNSKIENYLVDIGGEVIAKGKNSRGLDWVVGINEPKEGASPNEIQTKVNLGGKALATSGNYRNFYEVDGIKYSHTINPKNGQSERNTLLSASVFAPTCMLADAYATACMALGPEEAMKLAERLPYIEAYFIIGGESGDYEIKMTPGAENLVVKN